MADINVAPRTAQVPTYKLNENTGKKEKGPNVKAEVSMSEDVAFCNIESNVLPKGKQAVGAGPMVMDTVKLSGKEAVPFFNALQVGPEECQGKIIQLTTSRPDTKKAPSGNLPVFHD
jgi:hypothetical protein